MRCPACRQELVIVEYGGVELDLCAACDGVWFDADELHVLFARAGLEAPEGPGHALAGAAADARASRRRCPRCRRRMAVVAMPGEPRPVTVDRCPKGDGIWFDRGELSRLSAALGGGDAPLGPVREFLGRFAATSPGREK
jgi:Zn-finger nucleic acid-binding protein